MAISVCSLVDGVQVSVSVCVHNGVGVFVVGSFSLFAFGKIGVAQIQGDTCFDFHLLNSDSFFA